MATSSEHDLHARIAELEERLRGQERRLETLLGNLPGMAYRCANDPSWTMEYVSPGCYELTGYASHELRNSVAIAFGELIEPDDRALVWESVQDGVQGRQRFEIEYHIRHRSGAKRRVWEQGVPVFDANGELEAIEGFITDMTRRQRSLELAQQQQRFLQTLIDAIPLTVYYKDTSGIYLGCNAAYATFLGRPKEEIVGHRVDDLFEPRYAQLYRQADDALFASPGTQQYDCQMLRGDGSLRDVVFSKATYRNERGEIAGLIGVMTDVTERRLMEEDKRQLEAQLIQSQKAEALGILAGGIAHDFNNILMTMQGFAELALEDGREDAAVTASIEALLSACERATSLVAQILTFSRHSEVRRDPLELAPIVEDAIAMLRSTIPSSITIDARIHARQSVVRADANQIRQVLVNLANNAVHAIGEDGGRFEITLDEVTIEPDQVLRHSERRVGDFARLRVRDHGAGIAREHLRRIFDPYFTTKAQGKGTGLGLAVVQGIVRGHGGWTEVESELRLGTTFDIYLPLTQESAHAPERTLSPAPPHPGTGRLLLLDDEPSIVELQSAALRRLGYEVEGYSDPLRGIARLAEAPERFDLVITDMTMPNLTGDRVARRVRELRPDLPVILCTGYSERLHLYHDEPELITDCLYKPFTFSALGEAVRRALGAAQAARE